LIGQCFGIHPFHLLRTHHTTTINHHECWNQREALITGCQETQCNEASCHLLDAPA
jgi:hypothetical protein